jgi:hypothetical protein
MTNMVLELPARRIAARPINPTPIAVFLPLVRDVQGIIARTLRIARASGRDYNDQCRAAASAVMAVRPDLSLDQALQAVTRMRELGAA